MKKILVPTDFSEEAGYALGVAHDLAKKSNAEIFLLNVIEQPSSSFSPVGRDTYEPMDNVYIVQLQNKVRQEMEAIIDDYTNYDVKITYDIVLGKIFPNIYSTVANSNVDLIVMGSKGTSGVDEIFLGSNTEKVVRNAPCPVLTVKKPVDLNNVKNMVFASNFMDDQAFVVKELKKIQNLLNANLHLLFVNTPVAFQSTKTTEKLMSEFQRKNKIENCTHNIWNDSLEEEGIINFAEDINADLIAMGTHGRKGVLHLLSGSIAEDIVNHATRLVWTYKMK